MEEWRNEFAYDVSWSRLYPWGPCAHILVASWGILCMAVSSNLGSSWKIRTVGKGHIELEQSAFP